MGTQHRVVKTDYPVRYGLLSTPHHRVVCSCRIAFTRPSYEGAVVAWENHVARCAEGEELRYGQSAMG